MRATALEFRLRMLIQVAIVVVGFWAPWIRAVDLGRRVSLLEWLALELSRAGILRFTYATAAVILAGALAAAIGMVLRLWGSAYLGYTIVRNGQMQAPAIMASGPYRFVRNPLYLGDLFILLALALLMPPTGALFTMILVSLFHLRLILGEEAYLTASLGEPYEQYRRAVPRLFPRLRSPLPRGVVRPRWLAAALTEIVPIGVFIAFAFLSWRFDNNLMVEAVVIAFLISMLERGLRYAPIATCVFLASVTVLWHLVHMRPVKAALIGFGMALIAHAVIPRPKAHTV